MLLLDLRANFPGWEITAEASVGSPARELVRKADEWKPDKLFPPVSKIVDDSNQADREWLKKILENSSQRLRQSELKVLTEIREGDPKRVLGEAAKEWGADSIFVGSIGFSNPFERFVLGSVSASVAARAHCSVEVVRPRNVKELFPASEAGVSIKPWGGAQRNPR